MAYFGLLLAEFVQRVESWPPLKAGALTSSHLQALLLWTWEVSELAQSSGFLQKLVCELLLLASLC